MIASNDYKSATPAPAGALKPFKAPSLATPLKEWLGLLVAYLLVYLIFQWVQPYLGQIDISMLINRFQFR